MKLLIVAALMVSCINSEKEKSIDFLDVEELQIKTTYIQKRI
jgi:hypothetical protein